jgi:hypothetical protein
MRSDTWIRKHRHKMPQYVPSYQLLRRSWGRQKGRFILPQRRYRIVNLHLPAGVVLQPSSYRLEASRITMAMSLCCGFASRCFSHSSSWPRRTALCRLGSCGRSVRTFSGAYVPLFIRRFRRGPRGSFRSGSPTAIRGSFCPK